MSTYYYVYRVGYNHPPKVKHASLELAVKEAERLAAQHPGESFEVLQCLAVTRTITPHTFWMDGVTPPHTCEMYRLTSNTCAVCTKPLSDTIDTEPTSTTNQ
jgi:hypothetical protein